MGADMQKNKGMKLYLLVGLGLILTAMIVLRYLLPRLTQQTGQEVLASQSTSLDWSSVNPTQSNTKTDPPWSQTLTTAREVRNIFAALEPLRPARVAPRKARPVPACPSFQLKGTIVGSGPPLALIDDRMLRIGSTIQGFRVKRITASGVLLEGKHHKVQLVMGKNE